MIQYFWLKNNFNCFLHSMKIAFNLLHVLGLLIASFKFKCLNMILTNYQYSFHIITTHTHTLYLNKDERIFQWIVYYCLNAVDVLNHNKEFVFFFYWNKCSTVYMTATIEFWSHLPTTAAYPPFSACSIYQSC